MSDAGTIKERIQNLTNLKKTLEENTNKVTNSILYFLPDSKASKEAIKKSIDAYLQCVAAINFEISQLIEKYIE